jgi:diguanylate cyclase (GGDEF)-like protein
MRLGGDEFAMFIPGITETKDAESFTMRVFAKLKDIRIPEMGDEKIYVSMGEAFYKGEKDIDFDELYRRADSAMYKSKNNIGYCATLECVTKTF